MPTSNNYDPRPPRVWSRVQNQCTFVDSSNNAYYESVYIPLTNQFVTLAQTNQESKQIQKGNILQYKGNSSQLTKKQKYAQLAKGFGPNRTKVFATQSETYTNPNTTGLARVNSVEIPFPNLLVGQPNNISGPFQYAVPNPNGCTGFSVQDGGNLVCGTFANPCTGEIIKRGATSSVICNPASASNVPGNSVLCWNKKVQTWFPRQRYFMNNSGNKWPQGYKGFVSAIPFPRIPTTLSGTATCEDIILSWVEPVHCFPISGYNIYVNNSLYTTVSAQTTSYEFTEPVGLYRIYITVASSRFGESAPSNVITILITSGPRFISSSEVIIFPYEDAGYTGYIVETILSPTETGEFGTSTFTTGCATLNDVSILVVGGGGGGSSGFSNTSGGAGGGGGAINYVTGLTISPNVNVNVKVGAGGAIRGCNIGPGFLAGYPGVESSVSILSVSLISSAGGPGYGAGSAGPGGGVGGNATRTGILATDTGDGGGGGGGAWTPNGTGNATKFGPGGTGYTNNGNNGTIGTSIVGGNGGNQSMTSIVLPFLPGTIYVSGGGGGGGPNNGGGAGNGNGGIGNSAVNGIGEDATNYGGGGGGGAPSFCGGTGANGVFIIWWPTV